MFHHHIFGVADKIGDVAGRDSTLKQEAHERVPEDVRRWRSTLESAGEIEYAVDLAPPSIGGGFQPFRYAACKDLGAMLAFSCEKTLVKPIVRPSEQRTFSLMHP
jgi:hypothetical protein